MANPTREFTKDYIDGWLDAAGWCARMIENMPTYQFTRDGPPYADQQYILQAIEDEAEIMAK